MTTLTKINFTLILRVKAQKCLLHLKDVSFMKYDTSFMFIFMLESSKNCFDSNNFIHEQKKVSIYKVTNPYSIEKTSILQTRYTNSALTWNIHSSACTGGSSCGRSSKSGGTGSIPRPTGSFYGSHWSSRSHSSFFITGIRTPISGTGRHFPFSFFSSKRLSVAVHTLETR